MQFEQGQKGRRTSIELFTVILELPQLVPHRLIYQAHMLAAWAPYFEAIEGSLYKQKAFVLWVGTSQSFRQLQLILSHIFIAGFAIVDFYGYVRH